MADELHVLFGGGQVGLPLAKILLARGKRVRIAKRSAGGLPDNIELVQGDASDRTFCVEAARGAATVYHCMNPPYYANIWAELLPGYMDNLIAAAGQAGARLVVLDNVYMLGRPPHGKPLNEDTPPNPCSRKGEVRARVAERMWQAHRRGDVRATTGRASDYYGPGGTLSHLGDQFWRPVIAGRRGLVLVDPNMIHTYHYIPDVAAGLAALGTADDDVYGKPWMLPCAPAETMRQLVARLSQKLGREIKLFPVPRIAVKALALVVPFIREIDEMLYQWQEPFRIDDSRFRARFNQGPENADRAAAKTVGWARTHYGSA